MTTEPNKTAANIPFQGFCNSMFSDLVEREIESYGENRCEVESDTDSDEYFPEPLQLDHGHAWESFDYQAAHMEIAQDYAQAFGEWLDEQARDIDPDAPPCLITFDKLDSPREYNFTTDQIDVQMSCEFVEWMFKQAEQDGFGELVKILERRHKSRDGFISFYSHRLPDWLAKPVQEWDIHELRSLLESVFANALDDDWKMSIYYRLADHSYMYLDSHMDWEKLETATNEARAEKLAEWIDSDPERAGIWMANNPDKAAPLVALLDSDVALPGMPYRCTKTPDLFSSV